MWPKIFLPKFFSVCLKKAATTAIFLPIISFGQEISCTVIVNSEQVEQTNQQVFKTLERAVSDYVNRTKWTNSEVAADKRIQCSMQLTITSFEDNNFSATLQVQSNRMVYGTDYQSPVFNHQDRQFNFRYLEFEPLYFNPNIFESNLTAVLNYYVYILLGIDADTYESQGGTSYYKRAQEVVNLAQGSGFQGWQQTDGNRTRWELVDNLLSNTFQTYRNALYAYHRQGLDIMVLDPLKGKQQMLTTLLTFERLNSLRPNSMVLQSFFDAKSDEIAGVFGDGPKVSTTALLNTLNRIAPLYNETWSRLPR